jgi:hypothetical protein
MRDSSESKILEDLPSQGVIAIKRANYNELSLLLAMFDPVAVCLQETMPDLISRFLSGRQFRVRVGSHLSNVYQQEMGVPQGSILSVTVFILKINRIVECLPVGVRSSLYVDDFSLPSRFANDEN